MIGETLLEVGRLDVFRSREAVGVGGLDLMGLGLGVGGRVEVGVI